MSLVGKLANALDGLPVVQNSTDRDTKYPSPDTNHRVHNLATGYVELYDGANWVPIFSSEKGGNQFNVKAYGAKGDGVTDDGSAILAAIAAQSAAGRGRVFVPPGLYNTSKTFTESGSVPLSMECAGVDQTVFQWVGPAGGKVFQLTQERSQIMGGCSITATVASGNHGQFIGISHEASRQIVEAAFISYPNIGVQVSAKYGIQHYGLHIWQVMGTAARGINLLSGANSNLFLCKEVSGTDTSDSVGIYVNGEQNFFVGNELAHFGINLQHNAGRGNEIHGFFNEAPVTYSVQVDAGAVYLGNNAVGKRVNKAAGARILTPTGGYAPGIAAQPDAEIPTRGLVAYYACQEGTGTVLRDSSGSKNHATMTGGSWVAGAFGNAIQIDGTHIIQVPTATLTYTGAWTLGLLLRQTALSGSGSSIIFTMIDGSSNRIDLYTQPGTTNVVARRNGVFVGNLSINPYDLNGLVWIFVSYDGSSTITLRAPENIGGLGLTGQSYAMTNPLTGLTGIDVHNSNTNGTIEYHSIALWNREITADEALAWANMRHVIVPPQAPKVLSVGLFTLSAAATTVVSDKAMTSGAMISFTPTNAAAATLMNGTKSLYVSAKSAGASFTVATGDGTAAAGTETFDYKVVG